MKGLSKKDWDEQIQIVYGSLLKKLKDTPHLDIKLISKAFDIANTSHKGQFRESSEPYIIHPIEVASIVADLNMDTSTIIAALLHDTIEDTILTYKHIKDIFGEKIANIVQGISKLTTIESKSNILSAEERKVEDYRNLMCAVSKDIRILVIKLADRLHNMRTLHCIKNPKKRKRIALETMDIHSALAERIGIHNFKNELQDLAFAELYSQDKLNIEGQLSLIRKDGGELVNKIVDELKNVLISSKINLVDVTGREKKICSIWRKIQNKKLSFENLSDIFAFRVVVQDVEDCYKALCAIHNKYHMVPGAFKDYISTPKTNGYKSLHTIIIGPESKRIEIQIRTDNMHKIAEFGVAAHWQYKQQFSNKKDKHFKWIREILAILQNSSNPSEILEYSKMEMHYHQVFCFTNNGKLVTLPKGATALDFAFYISADIGLKCIGAVVNKETVPIAYQLDNGDQVEIICAEKNKASEVWLEILTTGKAKTELKKYLHNVQTDHFIAIGNESYKKYLDNHNIIFDESKIVLPKNSSIKYENLDTLFLLIGQNKLKTADIAKASYPDLKKLPGIINFFFNTKQKINRKLKNDSQNLINQGVGLYFAECCFPVKGEKAISFLDKEKGYYVHRVECNKVRSYYRVNKESASFNWKLSNNSLYQSRLILLISNKVDSLMEVVNCIFNLSVNIVNITTTNKFEDFFECSVVIEIEDLKQLKNLISKLHNLELVYSSIRYLED